MSELTKRILFAVPAAIIVLFITWYGGGYFEILIAAIAGFTVWELHRMMHLACNPGIFPVSVAIAFIVWTFFYLPLWLISIFFILILFAILPALAGRPAELSNRIASSVFTGVYPTAGFLMLVHIRNLGDSAEGFWLTLTLFLMIWGNDIFAYFIGKHFGKKPLAPVISPRKTWAGFWAGFFGAAAGFLAVYTLANPYPLPLWAIFPAVLLVSTFGPLGDIAESSLKRLAGVKDSSSLLPGHGGFFDRFDSLILSAPFLFFLFFFLM